MQTKPKQLRKHWADEFRNSGKWVGWHYERDEAETSAVSPTNPTEVHFSGETYN